MFEQIRKQLMKWYLKRRLNETTTADLLVKDIAKPIVISHTLFPELIDKGSNTRAKRVFVRERTLTKGNVFQGVFFVVVAAKEWDAQVMRIFLDSLIRCYVAACMLHLVPAKYARS
jgi:hypothetical protein